MQFPDGWRHVAYDEIDSTNTEALRRASAGERSPLWLTARHQTRGRGRSGRQWTDAGTSLAATLLFSPDCEPARLPELSLVAGLAAHAAITAALPEPARASARLKWPNDVLVAGAKLSGILIESSIIGSDPVAVIGTGINIAAPPSLEGRATASLHAHGSSIDFDGLSQSLAAALARAIALWDRGANFAAVRAAWLASAGPIGEAVTVNTGDGPASGLFAGLDATGALLVDAPDGARRRYTFGDVALVSPNV